MRQLATTSGIHLKDVRMQVVLRKSPSLSSRHRVVDYVLHWHHRLDRWKFPPDNGPHPRRPRRIRRYSTLSYLPRPPPTVIMYPPIQKSTFYKAITASIPVPVYATNTRTLLCPPPTLCGMSGTSRNVIPDTQLMWKLWKISINDNKFPEKWEMIRACVQYLEHIEKIALLEGR